jgi:hypothetical protein
VRSTPPFFRGEWSAYVRSTAKRYRAPNSSAEAVLYVLRVACRYRDNWTSRVLILVEYIHHTGFMPYDAFDKTRWNFKRRQASPEETRDCLSWMASEGPFHPTAFGAKEKLPDPKGLACFLMEKRPSVVNDNVPKPPIPSMRRPVDVKAHFCFSSFRDPDSIQPSHPCRHPSIRTLL